jgi:polyhydroxybutyrate depolymerase
LRPLVLVLHGRGGGGASALEQGGWVAKANAERFVVAAPEGVAERAGQRPGLLRNPRSWASGDGTGSPAQRAGIDDVGFLRDLIATLVREQRVDPNRIYATGFSNGAAMAFRAGVELADQIAAIAPVANALLVPANGLSHPVSLLMIWGADDPLNPVAGGAVRRDGETVLRPSAEETWRRWGRWLGCSDEPRAETPAAGVTRRSLACPTGSAAELWLVAGLGHQWPGGKTYVRAIAGPGSNAIDATEVIWRFFAAHRRQAAPNAPTMGANARPDEETP